ncbi:MAG: TonB-dependent receptor [Duncaniella sp.]|nr:TonB-dependent receptor [Duncaniella sp.]
MEKIYILLLFVSLTFGTSSYGQHSPRKSTLRSNIENIKQEHSVKFVYDSSIRLDLPYTGAPLSGRELNSALAELFRGTGLKWEKSGNYVIILPLAKYTLSGYVTQEDGETVINATVQDTATGYGTLTNEHGFYSLTLPEGPHTVTFSSVGCSEHTEKITIKANRPLNVVLKPSNELSEVIVTADLNSPLTTTQTGKISLTGNDLRKEYALFSSPDVVKTLQNLSGVASGTELTSGLYVHGGGDDENLYMLDGTPLYQVNHLGGLFSAFNTDVVKNIDFYKSGFPARYGGRLSSVVDVRTKDGNMTEYHGSVRVGLLDGSLHFEGPIRQNRTSFSIGMRRTWIENITVTAFAIRNNSSSKKEKVYYRYAFHDINAKITHIFSERSRADISIYSGDDAFRAKDKLADDGNDEYTKLNLRWGHLTAALNWKYQFSSKLYAVFTGMYTYNHSNQLYMEEYRIFDEEQLAGITHSETRNLAKINDGGIRLEFDYRPNRIHHIRFGSNGLLHFFHPQSYDSTNFSGDDTARDSIQRHGSHSFRGQEISLYAEDNIAPIEKLRINIGVHYTMFHIPGKRYHSLEPRVAVRYQFSDRLTAKASYTEMSQFMHQLSNSYLNLPMDYWVPSTDKVAPSRSRQYAAGVYLRLPHNILLNMEGFLKTSNRLIEYDGGSSLTPSVEDWDQRVRTGKGKSYGLEWEASYGNRRLSLSTSYTLSWNRRLFTDFYPTWYPDKFDNRHKFNISARYKLKEGIDVYASWCYHSGNRMTVPQQLVTAPILPGICTVGSPEYIYEQPNNVSLPAYHRLDLGVNFRKTTRKGYEQIWNISVYNATCHMNPFYASIRQNPDGTFIGKATAVFPILPSFSYTLRF